MPTPILTEPQIQQKLRRIAYEIYERHHEAAELILAGINNNGYRVAARLHAILEEISPIQSKLTRIRLNPAAPAEHPVTLEMPTEEMHGKPIIIVDDVANTGRTLAYACRPFFDIIPEAIQVAVLVERKHKRYPIVADFVGLSLATTWSDNVVVDLEKMVVRFGE